MQTDPSHDVVSDLQAFDLGNAHCYDPNEERKVRAAISTVGSERFAKRIQELAGLFTSKQVQKTCPSWRLTLWLLTFWMLTVNLRVFLRLFSDFVYF